MTGSKRIKLFAPDETWEAIQRKAITLQGLSWIAKSITQKAVNIQRLNMEQAQSYSPDRDWEIEDLARQIHNHLVTAEAVVLLGYAVQDRMRGDALEMMIRARERRENHQVREARVASTG